MSVLTIFYRNVKWRFHNAFTIVITILQPLLWLALYSSVAKETMKGTGIENYTAFIFPGLIVLVSFSACGSCGIMNYLMKADGSFYRVLIAPVRRGSIVLGQLLEAVCCTFLEVGILTAISLLFFITVPPTLFGVVLIAMMVALTAFFMAGISYSVSLILPNEMIYETVMNAVVLPIFFLSTALFPADELRGALGMVIRLNPLTHVINAMRSIILYGTVELKTALYVIGLFLLLGTCSFGWALYCLKKDTAYPKICRKGGNVSVSHLPL